MLDWIQNFLINNFNKLLELFNQNEKAITDLSVKWGEGLLILILGFIIARIIYKYTIRVFKKYNLKEKIDKFEDFLEKDEEIKEDDEEIENSDKKLLTKKRLTERIKIDIVVAKSISTYIFLLFFKFCLLIVGIDEVANSLDALLEYLPSLFVGVIIGFFGIRFANFIYDVTYHTLSIAESNSKTKTSKIIATASKGLILFFTITLVLNFTKLIDKTTLNIILIGFISMVSLAGGIAFGLGGKEMAKDILDKFNNED